MPETAHLRAEELRRHFATSVERGRLGHSYLLTGDSAEALEQLALSLAGQILGRAPLQHPDFHFVRPESKARFIKVAQIRELERELYLRPYLAPLKVAVVFDAERMCLTGGSAANAFLKTLEEPPAHTLILLTSSQPALLLPTIVSRCLRLDLGFENLDATVAEEAPWVRAWHAPHPSPALRAYARAEILQRHWAALHDLAETHAKGSDEDEKEVVAALIESEFLLARQESIAHLQRWYWRRSGALGIPERERARAVRALEDMQAALAQHCEAHLAAEVCCLKIEGLV